MTKVSFRRRVEVLERRQSAPRPRRSVQFDEDALRLYDMAFELHGRVQPDWRSIKEAPIGIRGKELRLQKYGPIIPAHEDPAWSRWTQASSEFEICFNREPIAGDLTRLDVQTQGIHAA